MFQPSEPGGPVLVRGALSGRVWCCTAYKQRSDGKVEVTKKYDVTDQFERLALAWVATLEDEAEGDVGGDSR